jgi:hypothetical protein
MQFLTLKNWVKIAILKTNFLSEAGKYLKALLHPYGCTLQSS